MKPLLKKELPVFLERFGNFVDAEIRSIKILSSDVMRVIIACQDSARGFDWITLSLEFSGIIDAKIIENSKLSLLDMSDGSSIIYEDDSFIFGVGDYSTKSGIKNAVTFIISSNIKYEEGLF